MVEDPSLATLDEPIVTIAIPTFNRARFVEGCVLAALNQSYPHVEVLVSDNASNDETQEVLKRFTDKRLRVVKQKTNIGALQNWNFCLAEAKGKYIVFVPDDDRIAPHMLERMMSVINRKPELPIVLALCDVYESERKATWKAPKSRRFGTGIWRGTDLLVEYLRGNIFTVACSILLRTDLLRAQHGFHGDLYAAHTAGWAAMLLKGDAGLINESCGVFYCHESSLTGAAARSIDRHIKAEQHVAETINDLADGALDDLDERRRIVRATRRYLARSMFGIIFADTERGARSMTDVLPAIWRHRNDLKHIGAYRGLQLARPICKALLPSRMVAGLRGLSRAYPPTVVPN